MQSTMSPKHDDEKSTGGVQGGISSSPQLSLSSSSSLENIINSSKHPIHNKSYITQLKQTLQQNGVITLPSFLLPNIQSQLIQEACNHQHLAYYTNSTHNVYLSPINPNLTKEHPYNQQIISSKGCITTDQIPSSSILKSLYYNHAFQNFCANIVNVDKLYPYVDPLSEINVHYYEEGQELGWHFDNSSFAITLLLQKSKDGGFFEYIPNLRDSDSSTILSSPDTGTGIGAAIGIAKEDEYNKVSQVLNGEIHGNILEIEPSTLVIFRGRDCLHRVTPVLGDRMRILVVFAYNDQPGVSLSEEARMTFFGRTGV